MTTSDFVWPDDVDSNLVAERLHAAIREYMREAAKTAFDGYAGLRDKGEPLGRFRKKSSQSHFIVLRTPSFQILNKMP